MAFEDEMQFGMTAMLGLAGESFTYRYRLYLSDGDGNILTLNESQLFIPDDAESVRGVFAGDSSDVDFESIQGYNTDTTNAVSILKTALPNIVPSIDDIITKADGSRYAVTSPKESACLTMWDLELKKLDG